MVVPRDIFSQTIINSVESSTIKDRVIQLERISRSHGQFLAQLQQQLSDNQNDIDTLRGQIQESQHQLDQVVECQKQILLQLASLKGGNPTDSISEVDAWTTDTVPVAQSNDANTDYNIAITLMREKSKQDDAIAAFENFVKKYPDSIYQPNANYWLGQLNYNKGKKDNAAFYFSLIVKYYPQSPKAPDAMFKVGVIMQDKGNTSKAKNIYRKIIAKYPKTNSAKEAKKRLGSIEGLPDGWN